MIIPLDIIGLSVLQASLWGIVALVVWKRWLNLAPLILLYWVISNSESVQITGINMSLSVGDGFMGIVAC